MAKKGSKDIKVLLSAFSEMSPDEFALYPAKTMLEKIVWQLIASAAEGERAAIDHVLKTLFGESAKVDKIVIAHEEEQS